MQSSPSSHTLSADQRRSLRCLAETIIPASTEYGVPSAGGSALMYLTFPKGFEVEQGDWSLLDPVLARPKLYRDAD